MLQTISYLLTKLGNELIFFNSLEKSSCDSPPVKKKPEDKDSSEEEVFEVEASVNTKIEQASTTATDDTSGPDLTCSEQLPTTCSSPDPYVGGFPNTEGYLEDGIKDAKKCMGTKDKESSSSLDEKKVFYMQSNVLIFVYFSVVPSLVVI